jgi:membrane AbrB-like protein
MKFMAGWKLSTTLRMIFGYALASSAGYGASLIHLPLAWVLGPLIAAATVGIAGVALPAPVVARRCGQLIIGTTVGLSMTSAVVAGLVVWLPLMIFAALFSVFLSATFSTALAQFARIDGKTAFFAILPGGLSEMGNIGASVGARMEPIALIQALRVAIIVLLVPPLLVAQGLEQTSAALPNLSTAMVAIALAASLAGALLINALRLNNPFVIGAVITTGILTATDLLAGRMPVLIFTVGQVLIGYNIGTRFQRDALKKLPRVAAVGIAIVLVMIAIMALYAEAVERLFKLDFASGFLAACPGGMAEMAATAQILHLPVALITAFHVTRSVLVNGFATYYWRGLSAIGYLPALEGVLKRMLKKP